MTDISPLNLLLRAMRFWWVVAACAAAGGLLGLLFASAHAPVYEASAAYRVAFDQTRAPQADSLDIEAAKEAALDIFFSAEVQAQVAEKAKAEGLAFSRDDFGNGTLTIQRVDNRWWLTVRNENARAAAAVANAWAAAALPLLEEAYGDAREVDSLQQQIATLQGCFASADLASANTCAGTDFANLAEYDAAWADLNSRLNAAQQASRGLVAALSLERGRQASAPARPVHFGRNSLVLAGLFLGFLLGVGLTLVLPIPTKRGE
jgi:uncharacterized protein involved in exopolysaccharide biosynthesis